jgi:GNAT superfamily N-acetyltransferase
VTTLPTDFSKAIEVFARGFGAMRSLTHPYVPARVEGLWRLSDGPRRRDSDYRKSEWIAWDASPGRVHEIVTGHERGRFAICHIRTMDQDKLAIRDAYKSLGYRMMTTEPFMVAEPSRRRAKAKSPARIELVQTQSQLDAWTKAAGQRQMLPAQLGKLDEVRGYVAIVDETIVGAVRSVVVGDRAWVGNLFVDVAHRRQGIGKALMTRLLDDDAKHGCKQSVLLASHTGALLYPEVGYEQIGELMMFVRSRKKPGKGAD